jgi:predicted enzyme related to lactoylglutathione lyase
LIDAERVDFIAVPTRDQERAVRFYEEILGLARNPNSSERWVEFEYTGRTEFTPSSAPIALRVPNVEKAREKLQEAGVEFQGEIIDSGVCHIAGFSDPDGNSLILHHRYAPYADGTTP